MRSLFRSPTNSLQRTFEQMASPQLGRSSSQQLFGDSEPSRGESPSLHFYTSHRHLSHPHNPSTSGNLSNMADTPRNQPRPHLEHRTSQTVIDLTDDVDEPSMPRRPRLDFPRGALRRARTIGGVDGVIDLTEDSNVDVEITEVRVLPASRRTESQPNGLRRLLHQNNPRPESPLFVPEGSPVVEGHGHMAHLFRFLPRPPTIFGNRRPYQVNGGSAQDLDNVLIFGQFAPGAGLPHVHMDYEAVAFAAGPGVPAPLPPKPQYEPPAPSTEGFTRTPTDDDIVICPACEKELVMYVDDDLKKAKVRSKKDREEHPFWVVKNCGHVSLPREYNGFS
jgi:hypothetical protein